MWPRPAYTSSPKSSASPRKKPSQNCRVWASSSNRPPPPWSPRWQRSCARHSLTPSQPKHPLQAPPRLPGQVRRSPTTAPPRPPPTPRPPHSPPPRQLPLQVHQHHAPADSSRDPSRPRSQLRRPNPKLPRPKRSQRRSLPRSSQKRKLPRPRHPSRRQAPSPAVPVQAITPMHRARAWAPSVQHPVPADQAVPAPVRSQPVHVRATTRSRPSRACAPNAVAVPVPAAVRVHQAAHLVRAHLAPQALQVHVQALLQQAAQPVQQQHVRVAPSLR